MRQARPLAQHLHPEGHGFNAGNLGQLINKAFIEKSGVIIRIAPPPPHWNVNGGGIVVNGQRTQGIGRHHSRDGRAFRHACGLTHRFVGEVAIGHAPPKLRKSGGGGDFR